VTRLIAAAVSVLLLATASTAAAAATPSLYVANAFGFGHPASLLGYLGGAAGNVAPVTDVTGSATSLSGAFGVARDPAGQVASHGTPGGRPSSSATSTPGIRR
jgi:hypothetical protein